MSSPNTKSLFISHAWNQNQHYWERVVGWLESETNFFWRNCSCPDLAALPDRSSQSLSEEMTRQIASAQAVIILSELYAANSDWVDYQISEAKRMKKLIIGVAPLERGSMPREVREAADLVAGSHSTSLVNIVRFVA